jgi:choline-glycine betaine transporter
METYCTVQECVQRKIPVIGVTAVFGTTQVTSCLDIVFRAFVSSKLTYCIVIVLLMLLLFLCYLVLKQKR